MWARSPIFFFGQFGGLLPGLRPGFQAEAEEVHVRRRVDDAQGAVDLEGVDAGLAVETLREDALEDVAGGDVLLGGGYGLEEGGLGGAGVILSLPFSGRRFALELRPRRWLGAFRAC